MLSGISGGGLLFAQNKKKSQNKKKTTLSEKARLENRKKQLLNDISSTGKLLKETEKSKEAALQRALLLNTKIQQRNQLIDAYREEVSFLDVQITANRSELSRLEDRLNAMKENYGRMVFMAYKNREDTDQLIYLLASDNVNNAYRRMNYFRQVAEFRKVSAEKIMAVREEVSTATRQLEAAKQEKNTLLSAETSQKQLLETEKGEAEILAKKLKGREKELRNKIEKAERERLALEVKIKKIIDAEIEAERRRAEEKARMEAEKKKTAEAKKSTSGTKPAEPTKPAAPEKPLVLSVTPETRALSNSFEGNKGLLPWPVERGVISGNFGTHPHPVLKNISVKNDGVDITAPAGAEARAVFGGVVSGVFPVEGFGNVVILRHGEYLTVYSNLGQVSVGRDQKVNAKQKVGTIQPADNGKSVMNFQIRKGTAILNPAGWLAR